MYIDDIEITGNTVQVPQVSWDISASSQTVEEKAGTATFTAGLSVSSNQNVIVPFTVSGTASGNGIDHDLENGSITIPAGSLHASKSFSIIDDSLKETDKTVILTMRIPENATLGTPANLTITIKDDDSNLPDPDIYESNNTESYLKYFFRAFIAE